MYRTGLVINENETSHSKYADTEATLKSAIGDCNQNGRRGNSYHFIVYDKFTISRLFDHGQSDISTLNSLIIATNALGFDEKLHNALSSNKKRIEQFIDARNGVCVLSQKKLSNGSLAAEEPRTVGFLPDAYDYYLFDRPEQYSSEGTVTITAPCPLLEYPYLVDDELIEKRCTNNQFMVHRYRSVVIPKYVSAYDLVLRDKTSTTISKKALGFYQRERPLLIYSRGSRRIVVSTMALDWANHAELLCNILTYVTESGRRLFFVNKGAEIAEDEILDSYMIRANIANIPYRAISEGELTTCKASGRHAFVFSPDWGSKEVEDVYASLSRSQRDRFTLYHISNSGIESDRNHKLSKFRNYSSTDVMKDSVIEVLLSGYQAANWGRSVWTYSYVVKLLEFYSVHQLNVAKRVYQELGLHFTKVEAVGGERVFSGDYDGVFNATCKMLEVLNIFSLMYGGTLLGQVADQECEDVIEVAEKWMLQRVKSAAVFDQDICYCLLYLTRTGRFVDLDGTVRTMLLQSFDRLLTKIAEEFLSGEINSRSSVDLSRVYQTLCALTAESAVGSQKAISYLPQIESTLKARQDIYGNWKHVSETAEITLMLLEAYHARSNVRHELDTVRTLIGNGVVALQSQYSPESSSWADDIGVTAKAMNAIGLYDRVFKFSVNDFFSDLKIHREPQSGISEDLTKERIAYFYRVIDALESEKDAVSRQLDDSETKNRGLRRSLSRVRYGLASSLAMFVGTVSVLLLFLGIFYIDQRQILEKELGDWRTVLEGAVAGVIVAVVLSEVFRWFGRRFRE